MLAVSCLSQKGGVGKSTLARLIATYAAHAKWVVKIADFNLKQRTAVDWGAARLHNGITPEVPCEAFSQVRAALKQSDNFDLMVFDGKPDSDPPTLEIAQNSGIVIIPVGTTLDDLMPQVRFANELTAKGIERSRILVVVNRSTDSEAALRDAREYVSTAGLTCAETDIPMRPAYQMAQNTGKAILETPFDSLNERAALLGNDVMRRLTSKRP